MDIATVAARIKALRQAMDKTQAEIATATGIPLPTWKKYEAGDREPGTASLAAMAATGVDLHWLLTGEGDLWRRNGYPLLSDILEQIKNNAPKPKGKKKYAPATATRLTTTEPVADVNAELLAIVIDGVEKTEHRSGGRLTPAQKIELITSLYLGVQSAPL